MTLDRGTIVSFDSRGRITLQAGGRSVVALVMNGGGWWIGDSVEGRFEPGLQLWRNTGNGVASLVRVQLAEVATGPDPSPARDAQLAA